MAKPKSWKKGQSGNPNGRPAKGYSITEMMQKIIATPRKDDKGRLQDVREVLATKILEKALVGDVAAQKMIWQYMDGMPLQKNEITGAGGKSIEVENKWSPEQAKVISTVFKKTFEELTKRK